MDKALDGITVLDFSHLLQGPFATQLLGDLGANIVKIERAGPGDLFRSMTFFAKWIGDGESPNFLAWNRNKRSIALNLKSPEVHRIVMKMAETADVVVQNFRPGVMAKLGYGYEDFRSVNPGIIYCSGSGYGRETDPTVNRPGLCVRVHDEPGAVRAGHFGNRNRAAAQKRPSQCPPGARPSVRPAYPRTRTWSTASAALLLSPTQTRKGQKIEVNRLAGMMAHLNRNTSPSSISIEGSGHTRRIPPASAIRACRRPSRPSYGTRERTLMISIAMSPFSPTATACWMAPHAAE